MKQPSYFRYMNRRLSLCFFVFFCFALVFSCTDREETALPFIFNPVEGVEEKNEFPDLIISEVAAVNERLKDRDYDDPDWIELYNRSDDSIDLGSYYLSDDRDSLTRWAIPDTVIAPGQFILIMASGKDYREADQGGDTVGGITRYTYAWADEDDQSGLGKSSIEPYRLERGYRGVLEGDTNTVLSATMNMAQNTQLGWRSAVIHMGWDGWRKTDTVNMSRYDRLLFKGYIEKDKKVLIRINQQGIEEWMSYKHELTGTGKEGDIYTIPLIKDGMLDLTKFYAVEVANPDNFVGSVSFTVEGFYFITCEKHFHTNFSLGGNETVFLSDSNGKVVDSMDLRDLPGGFTMRRNLTDSSLVSITDQPTPGEKNATEGHAKRTPAPEILPGGGFFQSPVNIRIAAPANTIIRYTLDGSVPDTSSILYERPFKLDSTAVVRARAYKRGEYSSSVNTASVFIRENTDMAVVSLVTDSSQLFDPDTGIYSYGKHASPVFPYFGANFWGEKEVAVSVEMYDESKSKMFAHDAGLRIFGNWSRANEQKSLSVHFRGQYGVSELKQTLFPEYPHLDKFKKFVLRNNGSNCGKTGFRDVLMCSLLEDRDLDYQKYRPVVVYINGAYWGIYNLREKLNEDYLWTNYGLEEGNFDIIKAIGDVTSGNRTRYDELTNYMSANDISKDEPYQHVRSQADLLNYATYMASEMFYGNTDWPANNIKFWRSYQPGSKWRWILYDTDFGFQGHSDIDVDMFEFCTNDIGPDYPNGANATFLFRTLLQNEQFKADFISITSTLLNTNFRTKRIEKRIDEFKSIYSSEISRHYERWGFKNWDYEVDKLYEFAQDRKGYFVEQMKRYFDLGDEYELSINVENGAVLINGLEIFENPYTGTYFSGSPLTLEVIPATGKSFVKWSDGNKEPKRTISPEKLTQFTASCQ